MQCYNITFPALSQLTRVRGRKRHSVSDFNLLAVVVGAKLGLLDWSAIEFIEEFPACCAGARSAWLAGPGHPLGPVGEYPSTSTRRYPQEKNWTIHRLTH